MDQKMKEQIRKIARAAAQKQVSASKETYTKPRTVSVPPIPAYKPSTPNYKPAAPAYKLPKPTTIKPHVPKSATMFYTAPEKGGIISSSDTPKSLKQRLDEMKRKQEAIAAADRQQYRDMLKGLNTDKLDAQRKQYEQELSDMKTAYATAMGVGSERKPKNQLTPESKNDRDFWEGFRKGIGLKDGEEIGRETPAGMGSGRSPLGGDEIIGRPGFSAQDGVMHGPGVRQDEDAYEIDKPDPREDDHVYITPYEYGILMNALEQELEGRGGESGSQPSYQDIYMQMTKLDQNREWSEQNRGKIKDNAQNIIDAANYFGVDPQVVAGVIFAENSENVNNLDKLTDWTARLGIDTSVGLGQVKMSTAEFLEQEGYIKETTATDGNWGIAYDGDSLSSRYDRLMDERINCFYVAAYIKYFQNTWVDEFPTIAERPDILGTLYNVGQREPNPEPEANLFGRNVMNYYDLVGTWLE